MFKNIDLEYQGSAVKSKASMLIALLSVGIVLFSLITMLVEYQPQVSAVKMLVQDKIDLSGVTNPVTAVLLNFRAYDTLLELAVLLIAVTAVLPIRNKNIATVQIMPSQNDDLVVVALQRWISPSLLVFAGYLLWAGATQPGGAFQAGALLAGSGVLLFQTTRYKQNYTSLLMRYTLCIGLMVFVGIALALLISSGKLLQYPVNYAGLLILIIESFATLSIAASLVALYSTLMNTAVNAELDGN